jgi:ATP synthase I chain
MTGAPPERSEPGSTPVRPDGEAAPEIPPNPVADAFYAGAEARATRITIALSIVATVAAGLRWGLAVAAGFALGAGVALVNLLWLKRVVAGFAAAVLNEPKRPSGARLVFRYFVRFALITLGALAIFKSSTASGYGFLAGLFVPVAGLMCEAAYEGWMAVRRNL